MVAIGRPGYKKSLKKASFTNVNRMPSLYSSPHSPPTSIPRYHHHQNHQDHIMPAPGSYAFPFLERIRVQMNEIEQILQIYSTKGAVRIETLPLSLVSFSENDYSSSRPIIESLQRRYHVLCSQEFLLVMAHKDEEAVEKLLKRIMALIAEIERTMHRHRTSKYHTPLPKSLLSCYSKINGVDMKLLEKRFETLKDQVK